MFRLIVNPGTEQAWEIPLKEGFNTLGSDPSTGCPIDHESVSATHCEVVVAGRDVQVLDLGSPQGTVVEGRRIEQAPLKPGQSFQMGAVVLQLAADEEMPAAGPGDPPLAPRISAAGASPGTNVQPPRTAYCKHHPKSMATWICEHCRASYCDLCVNLRKAGQSTGHFCHKCGNQCIPAPALPVGSDEAELSFFQLLPDAFSYPFRGNGLVLLLAGTFFFLLLGVAQMFAGFLGPYGFVVGMIIGVLTLGYLFSFAKSVITSSAAGGKEPPDWPDFTDWTDDILMPFGQLLALALLTFGPAAILGWWKPGGEHWGAAATLFAAALGAFLAPMGLLALAMFDSVAALNPVSLVWSILRIPLPYLIAAVVFEIVAFLWFFAGTGIRMVLPVPLLPGILAGFANLYLMIVGTRILGLLYLSQKAKLGWF